MSRFFWRLYLTVLGALVLFAVLVGLTFVFLGDGDRTDQRIEIISKLIDDALPPEIGAEQASQTLARWHAGMGLDLALYGRDGTLLAQAGKPLPQASATRYADPQSRRWMRVRDQWFIRLSLAGGRTLVSSVGLPGVEEDGPGVGFVKVLAVLALIGIAVAIAVYPTARRIARRFEVLTKSVDAFGAGDLSARVSMKGKDDIAGLAMHFNRSCDRIESLLQAQKSLLANASHELRSPLGRIRMAVTLFNEPGISDEERRRAGQELRRNTAELDELVDELLTASRLDAGQESGPTSAQPWESFDMAGLVAEECARLGISPDLVSIDVNGDRRLLRRLVRNLLENALRYGGAHQQGVADADLDLISVVLRPASGANGDPQITLAVCDRGPGVPADEAERIFEPFYRARGASEEAGGVGLGLSLVRQIANHHRGRVLCEARPEGGTCFRVYLPACPGGNLEPVTTG